MHKNGGHEKNFIGRNHCELFQKTQCGIIKYQKVAHNKMVNYRQLLGYIYYFLFHSMNHLKENPYKNMRNVEGIRFIIIYGCWDNN